MKKLLLLILATLSLTSFAVNPKIGVYVMDNTPISADITDRVMRALLNSKKYIVVERDEVFMSSLAKEYAYQHSGRVDETMVSKLGQQHGLNYICLIRIHEFGPQYCTTGKIVETRTANTLNTAVSVFDKKSNNSAVSEWVKMLVEPMPEKKKDAAKVGIYVKSDDKSDLSEIMEEIATAAFVRSPDFYVVDRNSVFQAQLDKEFAYQNSGQVNDDMIFAAGKQWGLDMVCTFVLHTKAPAPYLEGRLIDVETASIYATTRKDLMKEWLIYYMCLSAPVDILMQYEDHIAFNKWQLFSKYWQLIIADFMANSSIKTAYSMYKGSTLNGKRVQGDGLQYIPGTKDLFFSAWRDENMNGNGMQIVTNDNPDLNIAKCPGARFYVGEFKNGKKHGKGRCYDIMGNMIYSGEFNNGQPTDYYPLSEAEYYVSDTTFGFVMNEDGSFYLGELVNRVRNGWGMLYLADNLLCVSWKDDEPEGHAAFFYKQGNYVSLKYKDGQLDTDKTYVDLGLPSGTWWAARTDARSFYTFGEMLMRKTMYNLPQEIPTLDHWKELLDNCTWQRSGDAYRVTGPNGNSISILSFDLIHDLSGARKPHSKVNAYWSQTPAQGRNMVHMLEWDKNGNARLGSASTDSKNAIHWIKNY